MDKHKNILFQIMPVIFILFSVLFFFRSVLIPPTGKIIFGSDLNEQFYFWKSYYVESIKEGTIPFWNPYNFSGTPFLAHPSVAAFYPFNLIFFIFSLNFAFSVYLFIHIFLAGLFMFWYSRIKLDVISSLISAVVFALSGFFAARIYAGHVDIISTVAWIPLVFGSTVQACKANRKRDFLVAIFALTMQILAGYQFVVFITLELILLYLLFLAIFKVNVQEKGGSWRKIIAFAFIVLISYGLSAVQLLPTWQLVSHSIRAGGLPYAVSSWGSFTYDSFKLFVSPFALGNPFPESYSYHGPGPNYFELVYFVGVLPILLLIVYLGKQIVDFLRGKKIDKYFLSYVFPMPFFILVAMANNAPVNLHKVLFDLFFPYRLFRMPAQHLILVVFLLAVISGLVVSKVRITFVKLVFLILMLVHLLSFDNKFIRLGELPSATFDPSLLEILKKDHGLYRFLPDYRVGSEIRYSLDFESVSFFNIPSASGYNPIILGNYHRFIDLLNKNPLFTTSQYNVEIPPADPLSEQINFLNIKYIQIGAGFDPISNSKRKVFKLILQTPSYRLYENTQYLTRFFLAGKSRTYPTKQALESAIIRNDVDLSDTVLLIEKDIKSPKDFSSECAGRNIGQIEFASYTSNKIALRISSNCDGFLSSSEVYYPGWKARIDGSSTKVYLSNFSFRSIYVPKGEHIVEFYYDPYIYYIGGLISIVTLVGLILLCKRYETFKT